MAASEDPTQGRLTGDDPGDPTQGGGIGERPDEDPTQGRLNGEDPGDPTQGGEVGERPDEDPTQGTEGEGTWDEPI